MKHRSLTNITRPWLAFIAILILFYCHAWGLDPGKPVEQYLLDQWGTGDGLVSNTIISLNQTADGYLWIGTSKGLVRYDGIEFKTIHFSTEEEVYSQDVRALFVDGENNLWIGNAIGLTLYNFQTREFKTFTVSDGITGDGIRRITGDLKGNIWISFDVSFVNRYEGDKFISYNASDGLSAQMVSTIVEDRHGNLLFGTRENGIFIFKSGTFSKYPVPEVGSAVIIDMREDRSGDMWIATTAGLIRITGGLGGKTVKYTTEDGLSDTMVTSFTEDDDGNLWVGTDKGLNRLVKGQDGSINIECLLKNVTIYCLYEDKEKSIWIGTDGSGLKRLKDYKFKPFGDLPGEKASALFEDRGGDTWIGTDKGSLFRFRHEDESLIRSPEIPGLAGTAIAAIGQDGDGDLWLGTIGKGVLRKKNSGYTRFTTRDGLAHNQVTSIFKDSNNNLWFSTFDGISVRNYGNGIIRSLRSSGGLSGKRVYNVIEDKNRNIWITSDKGITVLKGGQLAKGEITHYLQGVPVPCIYEDPSPPAPGEGIFWIATAGSGLKRLSIKENKRTSYTTANGMTDNFIYQFLENPQGDFWLMSNRGILRVNKRELGMMASGEKDEINCISYGIEEGMQSHEFDNAHSRNSALKTGTGEFWFVTKKGIATVNPGTIRMNKTPPPVVLEKFIYGGREIPFYPGNGQPTMKGSKKLAIHFNAPTFLSPGKTKFKYRLEGADSKWSYLKPGKPRTARYNELSAGEYTFRVNACNAEGVWNKTDASLTFTIVPYFYQTVLFKVAVVLMVLLLAVAGFIFMKKRKPYDPNPVERKGKYKDSQLNPQFAEECITKLKFLLDIKKVYTDADISLQSLAEKMSIAPYQLSQLLNDKMDRNFADTINWYRIEEVKTILQSAEGAKRKIQTIAIEVGFNTMAAFYKAFKKHTGMTPTQYKKECQTKS